MNTWKDSFSFKIKNGFIIWKCRYYFFICPNCFNYAVLNYRCLLLTIWSPYFAVCKSETGSHIWKSTPLYVCERGTPKETDEKQRSAEGCSVLIWYSKFILKNFESIYCSQMPAYLQFRGGGYYDILFLHSGRNG